MTQVRIFLRGFVIVTLTAWNMRHIATMNYPLALVGGFGISFVWWGNSGQAAHQTARGARECYALGAALGTVVGMWLAG